MCLTYHYTYLNCPHRPSERIICAPSDRGRAKCIAETIIIREEGFICSACFDRLVWVRSSGEWEKIEEPEGDLGKDDWEKVERVGYDWQDEAKESDAKARSESSLSKPKVSRVKSTGTVDHP
jgi:hypothetical protein